MTYFNFEDIKRMYPDPPDPFSKELDEAKKQIESQINSPNPTPKLVQLEKEKITILASIEEIKLLLNIGDTNDTNTKELKNTLTEQNKKLEVIDENIKIELQEMKEIEAKVRKELPTNQLQELAPEMMVAFVYVNQVFNEMQEHIEAQKFTESQFKDYFLDYPKTHPEFQENFTHLTETFSSAQYTILLQYIAQKQQELKINFYKRYWENHLEKNNSPRFKKLLAQAKKIYEDNRTKRDSEVPFALAVLYIQESNGYSGVTSPEGAQGMWQFMPEIKKSFTDRLPSLKEQISKAQGMSNQNYEDTLLSILLHEENFRTMAKYAQLDDETIQTQLLNALNSIELDQLKILEEKNNKIIQAIKTKINEITFTTPFSIQQIEAIVDEILKNSLNSSEIPENIKNIYVAFAQEIALQKELWKLATIAYNAGSGNMKVAIEKVKNLGPTTIENIVAFANHSEDQWPNFLLEIYNNKNPQNKIQLQNGAIGPDGKFYYEKFAGLISFLKENK